MNARPEHTTAVALQPVLTQSEHSDVCVIQVSPVMDSIAKVTSKPTIDWNAAFGYRT